MTHTPNSYNLTFTVFDRLNGLTYDSQDPHRVFDTEAEATAFAEARLREGASFREDGTIEGSTWFWHTKALAFRVNAYFNEFKDHPPQFAPEPLSGPEWDEAWRTGPGAEAR
jgi:hypothetical protein